MTIKLKVVGKSESLKRLPDGDAVRIFEIALQPVEDHLQTGGIALAAEGIQFATMSAEVALQYVVGQDVEIPFPGSAAPRPKLAVPGTTNPQVGRG